MKSLLPAAVLVASIALTAQAPDPAGDTVEKRFAAPSGFKRVAVEKGSFGEYLRTFKLKPHGAPVKLYDGSLKKNEVWAAVLDMPILKKDLIQCADAIIKLRAEYLRLAGNGSLVSFTLTNGMEAPYSRFMHGERVKVSGNRTEWYRHGNSGDSREFFDEYLEFIYTYCGTASLSGDLEPAEVKEIRIGDVFIQGGSPGHAVMVMDLAVNDKGEKAMLLAQSYMPSQEMHIIKSYSDISPWYSVEDADLVTPEWKFPKGSLKRFGGLKGPVGVISGGV